MRIFVTQDKKSGWGVYKIFFQNDSDPVYIDSARSMYYSGHGYHSQRDTIFSFEITLLGGENLYILVVETERGYSNGTSKRCFESTNDGIDWVFVQTVPDMDSLKTMCTLKK